MKAMILAAGLGKRMRPLTDNMPKPLLKAGGKALIDYHLEALQKAGIQELVINTHWCADKLERTLGSGSRWQLKIHYSREAKLLETAGGIVQALPRLGQQADDLFLLINGDIFCDLSISDWLARNQAFEATQNACLAMVKNPDHHPAGDFALDGDRGWLHLKEHSGLPSYTYAGIALFRLRLFDALRCRAGEALPLAPLLRQAIANKEVKGELLTNTTWMDVGTPERLATLSQELMKFSR